MQAETALIMTILVAPPEADALAVMSFRLHALRWSPLHTREGRGVDTVGGAEAIISHVMSQVSNALLPRENATKRFV